LAKEISELPKEFVSVKIDFHGDMPEFSNSGLGFYYVEKDGCLELYPASKSMSRICVFQYNSKIYDCSSNSAKAIIKPAVVVLEKDSTLTVKIKGKLDY
jgi:hypothetical protein